MTSAVLQTINDQGIATITLNRPQVHNAFDDVLIQELLQNLKQLDSNSQIKIVILKAAGKSFSAGADLNWMRRMAAYSYEENVKDALALADLMQTLKFLNKPTLACVQGAAFGGGVGLISCCDIAIASTEASFCLSEVKIGLIPAVISPYVVSAIGERAARQYFLTAEQFNADEAHRLGLVGQVVPPEQLEVAVAKTITQILRNGPQAIIAAKKLINRVSMNPYDPAHMQKNAEAIATLRVSTEGQEGLSAFLDKRKPNWS